MSNNQTEQRTRGRPSVKEERTTQILDAFIQLVAERGLEAVTLDQVANTAGVHRSVIRHNIGNRAELIRAAHRRLTRHYDEQSRRVLGEAPTIADVVSYLFSDLYINGTPVEDRALDVLLVEARRDPDLATHVHRAYSTMIEAIGWTIRAHRPRLDPHEARELAYQVACLAESNRSFQRLAAEPGLVTAAASTASWLMSSGRSLNQPAPAPRPPE